MGHKTSLSNFKKIEIISSIFSNHDTVRLEINYKKEKRKRNKNSQHMEAKKHASKQPMDPLTNYRINKKYSKKKKEIKKTQTEMKAKT